MEHIGIDLGSRESQVCVRSGVGEIVEEKRCRTDSCLSRRISRIFLISSLRAGIAVPSCKKGEACRGQAADESS